MSFFAPLQLNPLLLTGLDRSWEFERATVLSIDPRSDGADKDGVEVEALVQVASEAPTADGYLQAVLSLTPSANGTAKMGKFVIERSSEYTDTAADPPQCGETPRDAFGPSPANSRYRQLVALVSGRGNNFSTGFNRRFFCIFFGNFEKKTFTKQLPLFGQSHFYF